MKKVIALSTVLVFGALGMACDGGTAPNANGNANVKPPATLAPPSTPAPSTNGNSNTTGTTSTNGNTKPIEPPKTNANTEKK